MRLSQIRSYANTGSLSFEGATGTIEFNVEFVAQNGDDFEERGEMPDRRRGVSGPLRIRTAARESSCGNHSDQEHMRPGVSGLKPGDIAAASGSTGCLGAPGTPVPRPHGQTAGRIVPRFPDSEEDEELFTEASPVAAQREYQVSDHEECDRVGTSPFSHPVIVSSSGSPNSSHSVSLASCRKGDTQPDCRPYPESDPHDSAYLDYLIECLLAPPAADDERDDSSSESSNRQCPTAVGPDARDSDRTCLEIDNDFPPENGAAVERGRPPRLTGLVPYGFGTDEECSDVDVE